MAPEEGDGIKTPKGKNGNKDAATIGFERKNEKEIQTREQASQEGWQSSAVKTWCDRADYATENL